MAKRYGSAQSKGRGSHEMPFESPVRPNNDWAYADGMVPEKAGEFGSAPMASNLGRFPHLVFGTAGLGARLQDGASGMDRHVAYIVPAGKNNRFDE
jgi:hypothetical protein